MLLGIVIFVSWLGIYLGYQLVERAKYIQEFRQYIGRSIMVICTLSLITCFLMILNILI